MIAILNAQLGSALNVEQEQAMADFLDAMFKSWGVGDEAATPGAPPEGDPPEDDAPEQSTAPEGIWRFVMVAVESLRIWKAIRSLPTEKRPQDVTDAYYIAMLHLEPNTGIVKLSREELAALMGKTPNAAGRAMGELVNLGVFTREYHKIAGLQGRGMAKWRVNPDVAWNGSRDMRGIRKAAAVEIKRSKADKERA